MRRHVAKMALSYFGRLKEIELQKFRKSKIIEDDIYIINHLDVFSVKNNKKTIMLYLSSDWFAELGFTF